LKRQKLTLKRARSAPHGVRRTAAPRTRAGTGARTSGRDKLALRSGIFGPKAIQVFIDLVEWTGWPGMK
jgi:hypothetical protein